jgi:hypothetical protein
MISSGRLRLKRDGTRAETRFRLSAKRTSPFKSAGASVQSTTGSRGVRISGINAGYTMFRGSVKSTGYPLHSPVSPSLPLPCVTACHQVSEALYHNLPGFYYNVLLNAFIHTMLQRTEYRGQCGTGASYPSSTSAWPYQYLSTSALHSFIYHRSQV